MNESVEPLVNENVEPLVNDNVFSVDYFDPANWDKIGQSYRDLLVEKGPIRITNIDFPRYHLGRHFSSKHYTRTMPNGFENDRTWLIYSISLDKVFCFCCKFKQHGNTSQLAGEGYCDRHNLSRRLSEHQSSPEHLLHWNSWYELKKRFDKNETIDRKVQEEISREREHWRQVLQRILAVVKALAKQNLLFVEKMRSLLREKWDFLKYNRNDC